MRIDAGLIIGIALEFVIMLYFANSTLQPKKNYYMSSAICFIGYLIIFGVSIFNMFIFNIISFTIIDFLIFILVYSCCLFIFFLWIFRERSVGRCFFQFSALNRLWMAL